MVAGPHLSLAFLTVCYVLRVKIEHCFKFFTVGTVLQMAKAPLLYNSVHFPQLTVHTILTITAILFAQTLEYEHFLVTTAVPVP